MIVTEILARNARMNPNDIALVEREPAKDLRREISWRDDVAAFFQIRRLILREKPALVHTHTSKAGMLGRLAACATGVPVIVHTLHGLAFRHYFGRLKSKWVLLVERMLAARPT